MDVMDEKSLIGKKIKKIKVNGLGVYIKFTDNTIFEYSDSASDDGYSSAWSVVDGNRENE